MQGLRRCRSLRVRAGRGLVLVALGLQLASASSVGSTPSPRIDWLDGAALDRALRSSGRPKLIHLWASWCMPCRAELPALVGALHTHARGVDVLFLAVEEDAGAAAAAARLLGETGKIPGLARYAKANATRAAMGRLDVSWDGSIPSTYLIDASGKTALSQVGGTDLGLLIAELGRAAKAGSGRDRTEETKKHPPRRER